MECIFAVIAIVLSILYLMECAKNRKMENDYRYINTRLRDMVNGAERNDILIPSDIKIVKETAEVLNILLEKLRSRQIEYNRGQKAVLQVFTNISHDLRTPITVLKGYIEMLYLQSQKEELSSAMRNIIQKTNDHSKDIVRSVNNLLNMAKIQSGDMALHIQRVNLTQVCHEVILEFYDLLERENFAVEVNIEEKPLYADIDIEAAQRILKNLIDNAIKHGGAGKFLGISLSEKDSHICIAVEDHGTGISEKDKEHIFARTYTAGRQKGNGLGLAISQGLANSMGGSISVSSIPQVKTVFTVTL